MVYIKLYRKVPLPEDVLLCDDAEESATVRD